MPASYRIPMSSLSRIAFLQRPRHDQLLALSSVLHVMERLLVLKHWLGARQDARIASSAASQPELAHLEDACIDSGLLTVRALDAFFTTRAGITSRLREDEVCAELFGYPHAGGFLGRPRREEIAHRLGHVTTASGTSAFRATVREDLEHAVAPSHKFLTWVFSTDFLDGEEALKKQVCALLDGLQMVRPAASPEGAAPHTLEIAEDVVKATTACLRAARSAHAIAFSELVRAATLSSSTGPGLQSPRRAGGSAHGLLSFPGQVQDLEKLIRALEDIQRALGEDSESSRILNWLHISWSELRRKVISGEVRRRSA